MRCSRCRGDKEEAAFSVGQRWCKECFKGYKKLRSNNQEFLLVEVATAVEKVAARMPGVEGSCIVCRRDTTLLGHTCVECYVGMHLFKNKPDLLWKAADYLDGVSR
jgi:hypothetical protein